MTCCIYIYIYIHLLPFHLISLSAITSPFLTLHSSMMCTPTILLFIAFGLSAAVPTLSYHKRNTAPGNAGALAPALVATVPSSDSATQCTGKASSNDLEFYQRLTSAPSAVQRQSLLRNADFVFDFMNPCDTDGATTAGSEDTQSVPIGPHSRLSYLKAHRLLLVSSDLVVSIPHMYTPALRNSISSSKANCLPPSLQRMEQDT